MKKCLFPIDAYVVWYPTWSKNLGRYLIRIFLLCFSVEIKKSSSYTRTVNYVKINSKYFLFGFGFLSLTLILGWGCQRPSSAGELWTKSDCGTWMPSMQLKFLWQSRSNCFKEIEPTAFPTIHFSFILYSQSHYIEVAQGGVSSRARHNWLWILN